MSRFQKVICLEECLRCWKGEGMSSSNPDGNYKLHDAARKFDVAEMRKILGTHPKPEEILNQKDEKQRTVLHILLIDGFLGHLYETNMEECVKLALDKKADPNVKGGNEETPLSLAVSNGFTSCAMWLVQYGANYSVRTPKYKGMHSLPSHIAETMPDVMMEILNSGVMLDYVAEGKSTHGEPEVKVKLDWGPVLQFAYEPEQKSLQNDKSLRKHKYNQREMSFLYSLLDVTPTVRYMFLTHPLVSAFLHMKANATSKKLRWLQMLLALYPIFYMLFMYFLYFNRCKFDEKGSSRNETSDDSTRSFSPKADDDSRDEEQRCEITLAISLAGYLLMAIVCGFGLVEVYVQFRVATRYLKSWRTWVLRASLIIMGVTLWPALQFGNLYNITWQYPFAALGTFFGWFLFLIQMELIPKVKIYLEMLAAITLSVIKITILFLPLLAGFYMGFNLMFFKIGGVINFILMTVDVGSNEYEEMFDSAKDNKAWFAIIAYVFSVAFIIVIAIVFMNFLLGVSINDIQELKRNAKIVALSNQVQNLFVIDLVFPTRYNVVPKGQLIGQYSYSPYYAPWKIPEEIRTKITLLLKSKYSVDKREQRASSTFA